MRFGIVDVLQEEFLKLTYHVFTVPQTFLIKNGTAYEMNTLAIFYDNIRGFIEFQHLEEKYCYQSFKTPRRLYNQFTVYGIYAYNDGLKLYNSYQWDFLNWLQTHELKEYEQVKRFFALSVVEQYHFLLALSFVIFSVTLLLLRMVITVMCMVCCSNRKQKV